ncbi:MAG: glutathione S-transferase family protein [Burkholderiaceae bacterium]
MTLKLYGIVASRASRPLWLLEEMGQAYELVPQDYRNRATRSPAFLAINPNGHIPVLDDDGTIVWESMAINLYLVRKFGGDLAPANLAEEAEVLRWTFWVVTEFEKDALTVLFHKLVMPADQRDPELARQAEKRLAVPLAVLERHLGSHPYVAGERFTVADVNLASVIGWVRPSAALLEGAPAVAAWLKKCLARPAHQRLKAIGR